MANGRTPGGEPRHTARKMKTDIEMDTNGEALRGGHHDREHPERGGQRLSGGFSLFSLTVCLRVSALLLVIVVFPFYTSTLHD